MSPGLLARPAAEVPLPGVLVARADTFAVSHAEMGAEECARVLGEGSPCRFIRVRQGDGAWGPPRPVEQSWASLSDGQGVVYASRRDRPLAIDTIDASGKITPIFDATDGKKKQVREVKVVPASSGLFVFGQEIASDDDAHYVNTPLSLIFLETREGHLVEARRTTIPIGIAGYSARDARNIRGGKIAHGSVEFAPSLDATGAPGELAVVAWTQVTLPPKAPPPWLLQMREQQEQERRERLEQLRQRQKKSKNACPAVGRSVIMGCAGSRSLDDPSIKRRRRLTSFTPRGLIKKDIVIEENPSDEGDTARGVWAVPGGWVVDAVRVSDDFKIKGPARGDRRAAAPPTMLVPDRLLLAHWDEVAREGLAQVESDLDAGKKQHWLRRFDAEGAWVGEPVEIPDGGFRGAQRVIHRAGEWRHAPWDAFCLLHDRGSCQKIDPGPAASKCAPTAADLVFPSPGDQRTAFFSLPCDSRLSIVTLDQGELRVAAIRKIEEERHVAAAARTEDGRAWALTLRNGAPAQLVPDDPALEPLTLRAPSATLHKVGRSVVVREHGPEGRLLWLGTGESAPAPPEPEGAPAEPPRQEVSEAGALLPGGRLLLGEKPGEVRELPGEIAGVARGCQGAFQPSPGRLLLLCTEAREGTRVTAVTLRRIDF